MMNLVMKRKFGIFLMSQILSPVKEKKDAPYETEMS